MEPNKHNSPAGSKMIGKDFKCSKLYKLIYCLVYRLPKESEASVVLQALIAVSVTL